MDNTHNDRQDKDRSSFANDVTQVPFMENNYFTLHNNKCNLYDNCRTSHHTPSNSPERHAFQSPILRPSNTLNGIDDLDGELLFSVSSMNLDSTKLDSNENSEEKDNNLKVIGKKRKKSNIMAQFKSPLQKT